jgi:hypothetical protein
LTAAAGFCASDSGPQLFSQVAARNQIRESQHLKYSVVRTYEVKDAAGRTQGQLKVLARYDWPNPKTFEILSEEGSHAVAATVFRPLMEHDAKASFGEDKYDSAIGPANYTVEMIGEQDIDGRHCFVLRATPRRRDKYLFDGTIWIDSEDRAVVRIEGKPAKNPSFWVKNVHFVRRYQKIGDFWLPVEDTSVCDVRLFGKHTLTIRYDDYQFDNQSAADNTAPPLGEASKQTTAQ